MIDKATADAMGITSMSQLEDASVAAMFDQDGDGLADLIGCNEGWGCATIINDTSPNSAGAPTWSRCRAPTVT